LHGRQPIPFGPLIANQLLRLNHKKEIADFFRRGKLSFISQTTPARMVSRRRAANRPVSGEVAVDFLALQAADKRHDALLEHKAKPVIASRGCGSIYLWLPAF